MVIHSVVSTESWENKKIQQQNVTPVGIEPKASDFHALHATIWANSLFAGSFRALDP